MRKQDLEYWILSIADRVTENKPFEDDRVELKSEWPIANHKTARQLAAHANVSKGESILWIVGLDEKRGVIGAEFEELSNWWGQIIKWFDESMYPYLTPINIPYEKEVLVGLFFETDRIPFVVKNEKGGSPEFEVPWRNANRTKTAHRSDLLRLLVPIQKKPEFEITESSLLLMENNSTGERVLYFSLNQEMYINSPLKSTIVIPFHKSEIKFRYLGKELNIESKKFSLKVPQFVHLGQDSSGLFKSSESEFDSFTLKSTTSELIINGPGKVKLITELGIYDKLSSPPDELEMVIILTPSGHGKKIIIRQDFTIVQNPQGRNIIAEYTVKRN